MSSIDQVRKVYNRVAVEYANKFFNELLNKPFDKIILNEFAKDKEGLVVDLGCGPGQTTKFLKECGVSNILGVDISKNMIKEASKRNPTLKFEEGNMLKLKYPDNYFSSAIAFYAIVHFDLNNLKIALNEIFRTLKKEGEFLFSFHIGKDVIHYEELLNHKVDIDFQLFDSIEVLEMVKSVGFHVFQAIERFPYEEIEYPSKRAYIWVKKLSK